MVYLIVFGVPLLLLVWFIVVPLAFKSKAEKEQEKRLKESLEDEMLYDPETGARISMDEAESGKWLALQDPERIKTDQEVDTYYQGPRAVMEKILNELRAAGYKSIDLSPEEEWMLSNRLAMFKKYDECIYTFPYANSNTMVLFPDVTIKPLSSRQEVYNETQLVFRLNIGNGNGHYYLRAKTTFEELLDQVKSDDDLKLDGFECHTIEASHNIIYLNNLLCIFKDMTHLELEVSDQYLFVKTRKQVSLEEFTEVQALVNSIIKPA